MFGRQRQQQQVQPVVPLAYGANPYSSPRGPGYIMPGSYPNPMMPEPGQFVRGNSPMGMRRQQNLQPLPLLVRATPGLGGAGLG